MAIWCTLLVSLVIGVITIEPHVARRNLGVYQRESGSLQSKNNTPSPQPCMDPLKCPKKGQKVYVFETTVKTNWFEAFYACARRGWSMASVSSKTEQTQLEKAIKEAGPLREVWLGATDHGYEGFTWMATGQPVNFSSWYPGEPSFAGAFDTCVVLFDVGTEFRWFNVVCYQHRHFACEYFQNKSSEYIDVDWKSFQ